MSTPSTPIEQQQWALQQLGEATRALRQAETVLDAYQQNPSSDWTRLTFHYISQDNPHGVTKAQVGLGSVMNDPMATSQQAIEGLSNQAYLSPRRGKEAMDAWFARIPRLVFEKVMPVVDFQHVILDPALGVTFNKSMHTNTDIEIVPVAIGRMAMVQLVLNKTVLYSPVIRLGHEVGDPEATRTPDSVDDTPAGTYLYTVYIGYTAVPQVRVEALI